jgi:hypothetical protein
MNSPSWDRYKDRHLTLNKTKTQLGHFSNKTIKTLEAYFKLFTVR